MKRTPRRNWIHGTDALDRPRVRLTPRGTMESRAGKDTGRYPLALFDDAASQWAEAAAAAKAQADRRPWERHVEKGRTWLVRWRARLADVARIEAEPPRSLPVFGERVGRAVPAKRWRTLQTVLEAHGAGRRIEDVPVVRSPRGRRHPRKMTEWDRYCAAMYKARTRAPGSFTPTELQELAALMARWRGARKCARPYCFQFIPREVRRRYCSEACKGAGKAERAHG